MRRFVVDYILRRKWYLLAGWVYFLIMWLAWLTSDEPIGFQSAAALFAVGPVLFDLERKILFGRLPINSKQAWWFLCCVFPCVLGLSSKLTALFLVPMMDSRAHGDIQWLLASSLTEFAGLCGFCGAVALQHSPIKGIGAKRLRKITDLVFLLFMFLGWFYLQFDKELSPPRTAVVVAFFALALMGYRRVQAPAFRILSKPANTAVPRSPQRRKGLTGLYRTVGRSFVSVVGGSSVLLLLYGAFGTREFKDVVVSLLSSDASMALPREMLVSLLILLMVAASGMPWSARALRALPLSTSALSWLSVLPALSLAALWLFQLALHAGLKGVPSSLNLHLLASLAGGICLINAVFATANARLRKFPYHGLFAGIVFLWIMFLAGPEDSPWLNWMSPALAWVSGLAFGIAAIVTSVALSRRAFMRGSAIYRPSKPPSGLSQLLWLWQAGRR